MSFSEGIRLWPIIAPAAAAAAILLMLGFHRNHAAAAALSLIGAALGFAALPALASAPGGNDGLLTMDGYALFYAGLILAASFAVVLMSYAYFERRAGAGARCAAGRRERPEEFYVLLMLATAGAIVLAASSHFVTFFLGLEVLSVSLYTMIAYDRAGFPGIEAGVKYLILAAASAAFLLFGMALIYADCGTMEFSGIAGALAAGGEGRNFLALTGLAMILVGVGFKLALAPFHLWTPDVYQGAPAPATAFLATVSKGAVFALLLRYFTVIDFQDSSSLRLALTIIAILSMFVGNLLALLQGNLKRILAYSSIAHSGYLLVALLAGGKYGPVAASYYLLAYFITTLGAWGIVAALSPARSADESEGNLAKVCTDPASRTAGKLRKVSRDAESLEEYRGLAWRRPWLAGAFAAMLLSLAGIPLTAGFVGKFYLLTAGVSSQLWLLVIVLVANSAIGLFYYVRIIVALFSQAKDEPAPVAVAASPKPAEGAADWASNFALGGLVALLLWFGIYPAPVVKLLESLVAGLR